ncbi:glycosyl hydrolase family 18 protein [Paenibacillus mucilaginosus]|uniref:Glycoside hydrolase family 18 n=1 Tax=Paenibacillus mucilaginosus (strain KNP414) TaxID=1036673 RepID=F8FD16_PAEMK|nr:glycosyl hydrolase family 18 protein [Paenibacillus mucilaginosus]AEI41433.1 glycoside hydrolase family 18 [Paenibacillus mucilaginosus KNP414]
MKRKTLISMSLFAMLFSSAGSVHAADKTTKYRVYQDQQVLMETASYAEAEAYARWFADSRVEEIGSRKWLWHNYPKYRVYQNGASLPQWKFASLEAAVAEASKWGHASVRDMESGGWVWNNYPKYRLYQGEITLDAWAFPTLEAAVAEARRWGNAHIIDLSTHGWVWDNIPAGRKAELRQGPKLYQLYQGSYTSEAWTFASLEDAVNASLYWSNSEVRRTDSGKVVHSNVKPYKVYQFDKEIGSFLGLEQAIAYAQAYDHTRITERPEGSSTARTIWNNYPYYQVYQNNQWIADFQTIGGALAYASRYSSASIRLYDDGSVIWDNLKDLQFWGWNGSSSDTTIRSHVSGTQGLDVVSPTYFQLQDTSGGLADTSNAATVAWLKEQGYSVHPLVANQFDSKLTTGFLASAEARAKFIDALVSRAVKLGVDGLNIDFESVSGSDRAAFTKFMEELTAKAHEQKLTISVDLPRGSAKWNAKTAFDHEKLAGIVDYVITMTYDQHWKGSTEPGSVAGLPWIEEGIREFLAYGIPRDKLIIGIPFYVREWKIDAAGKLESNRALLMKDLPALIESKKAVRTYDARFGQDKVEYTENGARYVFWMEDESTVKARIDLAKKYDLAGVAAWRLGYDPSSLWSMMLQQK